MPGKERVDSEERGRAGRRFLLRGVVAALVVLALSGAALADWWPNVPG